MRPWAIMSGAVIVALLICFAGIMTRTDSTIPQVTSGSTSPVIEFPLGKLTPLISPPEQTPVRTTVMRTTIEEPGGIKVGNPAMRDSRGWALASVAIVTAPKTMAVGEMSDIRSVLLTTAGQQEIESLIAAAKHIQQYINNNASSATNSATGLDEESTRAINQLITNTKNRQAAYDSLPASPIMTAHLAGTGFTITPVTPERQILSDKAPTTWVWDVKAVESGQQILTVSYNAEIMVENERVPRSLRTVSREVLVAVQNTELVKQFTVFSKGVRSSAEDLSWIWSTLVFAAGVFLYGLWKIIRERKASST